MKRSLQTGILPLRCVFNVVFLNLWWYQADYFKKCNIVVYTHELFLNHVNGKKSYEDVKKMLNYWFWQNNPFKSLTLIRTTEQGCQLEILNPLLLKTANRFGRLAFFNCICFYIKNQVNIKYILLTFIFFMYFVYDFLWKFSLFALFVWFVQFTNFCDQFFWTIWQPCHLRRRQSAKESWNIENG